MYNKMIGQNVVDVKFTEVPAPQQQKSSRFNVGSFVMGFLFAGFLFGMSGQRVDISDNVTGLLIIGMFIGMVVYGFYLISKEPGAKPGSCTDDEE